ncbi:type II secretion system GspH family protein [Psychrobium sp. MM17-31]|uniref:type II secretion system protein n=1 Tax=Psychrobium sp. MM17-31 TaxID=2917758 RepID=UPI001EF5C349|nr:type II secretion system protein [Psychrobium sp. MM17-31]MCG7532357.1 type II secretion system GspH family protein [Psychrobium sp. MM17-31]
MKRNNGGFTLIELVLVILVLAIVSTGIVTFIRYGVQTYQDTAGRDKQISDSRFVIERITRELRNALPNSVRVTNGGDCVEFIPILASSTYVDIPVLPDAASSTVTIVASSEPFTPTNTKLVVYPLSVGEVYVNGTQTTGKVFNVDSYSAAVDNVVTVTLTNAVHFDDDSPNQRYFIIRENVAYCWDTSGDIKRYQNVANPPSGTGVLMAENVVKPSGSTPIFSYQGDTLIRNAIVLMDFSFRYDDERLRLVNEVNIANVP